MRWPLQPANRNLAQLAIARFTFREFGRRAAQQSANLAGLLVFLEYSEQMIGQCRPIDGRLGFHRPSRYCGSRVCTPNNVARGWSASVESPTARYLGGHGSQF